MQESNVFGKKFTEVVDEGADILGTTRGLDVDHRCTDVCTT